MLMLGCGDSDTGSGGSGEGGGGEGGGSSATVDDAELSAMAADYASLTKANPAPFMSAQHDGMPMVNVFYNDVASEHYPITSGPFTFAEGSMIVKEMLGPDDQPMMLTAMYKGPAGYDPDNGDWWWGMLTLEGEPAMPGSVGKIAMCTGCHQGQSDTDFAFGIPATE